MSDGQRQAGRSAAAPPRGSSPSRTRRRGCPARARTRCRRTTGRSGRRAGTPRSAARTRRRRRARRRAPPARSTSAGVSTASPHAVQSTAGIGTPQARWREMHQSGRFVTMLKMRSRPQAGIHFTWWSMACCAACAQRPRLAVLAGDDRVAVHPDEPLRRGEEDHRVVAAPAVRVLVLEVLAVPQPRRARAAPPRPSGWRRTRACRRRAPPCRGSARPDRSARRFRARTSRRSGSRRRRGPGAVCTAPVPCSSVT